MSFDESIVVELSLGRKKIFFTILYRSPAYTSPELQAFLSNFKNLNLKIKAENPIATYFTKDFNAQSQFWWSDGGTTPESRIIEDLFTSLGPRKLFLSQQILNQIVTPRVLILS